MIIGLTGGIGSGKSAAADFFQNEGISVIDTDQLSRKVIEKDTPGYSKVVDSFGTNILDNNDSIDRAKLREEVFHDDEKREILEEQIKQALTSTFKVISNHVEDKNSKNEDSDEWQKDDGIDWEEGKNIAKDTDWKNDDDEISKSSET